MRRTPLSYEVSRVLKLLSYTLLTMLVVVSGYFFVKTSSTAEKGYMLEENQLRAKNLESENRLLKERVLNAQSITDLKSSEAIQGMKEPVTTQYVLPRGPLSKRR